MTVCAYFKNLQSDGYALLYNGVTYLFNRLNKFRGTDIFLPVYVNGAVAVNVLSILITKNSVDIGVSLGTSFKSLKVSNVKSEELIADLFSRGQFITTLTRSGEENEVKYTQCLYVYTSNLNVVNILKESINFLKFKVED